MGHEPDLPHSHRDQMDAPFELALGPDEGFVKINGETRYL